MGRPDFDEEAAEEELDGEDTDSSLGYAYFGARDDEDTIKLGDRSGQGVAVNDAKSKENDDGQT